MNECCPESAPSSEAPPPVSRLHELARWIAPGAALAIVPKCPACIAAYIALATGVGVSMTTAAHIRIALIAVCVSALAFAAARRLTRFAGSMHVVPNRSN
jgi:Flp pilus assembly protein TadB